MAEFPVAISPKHTVEVSSLGISTVSATQFLVTIYCKTIKNLGKYNRACDENNTNSSFNHAKEYPTLCVMEIRRRGGVL